MSPAAQWLTCSIKIDGAAIDKARVKRVRLSHGLEGHCSLSAEFLSLAASGDALGGESRVLDDLAGKIDAKVLVEFTESSTPAATKLKFAGSITGIVAERNQLGEYVVKLRGSSPTVFLDGPPVFRAFLDSKVSDLVSTLAGERGVASQVQATTLMFKELVQSGESDWQFLQRLAQREGMWLFYNGEKLVMNKNPVSGSAQLSMGSGGTGSLFKFTVSSRMQAGRVQVRGWDYVAKREVVGDSPEPSGGAGLLGQAVAKSGEKFNVRGHPPGHLAIPSAAEAEALAKAMEGAWHARRLVGQGESDLSELQPGVEVTVTDAGAAMSGKYLVTHVTHRLTGKGYRNRFLCLPAEAAHAPVNYPDPARPSVVTGLVTSLEDPDDRGRIRLKIPNTLQAGNYETWWARLAAPHAGPDHGFYWRPEVNDEVVVAFVEGNINEPLILGSVYSGASAAPREQAEGDQQKNEGKVILTRAGTKISIVDTDGEEKLEITTKGGKTRLTMTNKDKGLIELECKGPVTIKADDNITLDGQKDIVLKAMGNIQMEATGNLTMKGVKVAGEATGEMSLKGTTLAAEGSASAALKGGAMTEVKGGIVKIN